MAGRVYPALAAARVVSVAPGAQGHSAGRRAGLVGMTANRPERRPPRDGSPHRNHRSAEGGATRLVPNAANISGLFRARLDSGNLPVDGLREFGCTCTPRRPQRSSPRP